MTDELHEPDTPGFGVQVRRYRTAAGLSLRSLAEQVTFDYSYLAQVERGERGGSIRLARQCDIALGTDGYLIRLFTEHKTQRARQTRQSQQSQFRQSLLAWQRRQLTP